MTHLSLGICLFSNSIIPKKGGSLFFVLKNFEALDNTEYRSIDYINRFTLTKFKGELDYEFFY
jgi:hypothetical protein